MNVLPRSQILGSPLTILLNRIHAATFCRLQRSPIHGIGVFAIRKIHKGMDPFSDGLHFEYVQVPPEALDGLDPAVKKLVTDLCAFEEGVYWVPDYGPNNMGVAWFLNHSTTPNMTTPEGDGDEHGDIFYALRDIEPGEELTIDYGTYNDDLGLEP